MADWTYDLGPFYAAAERKSFGVSVLLELEDEGIDVDCEQGSGYGREQIKFHIPFDVLKALLKERGHMLITMPKAETPDGSVEQETKR